MGSYRYCTRRTEEDTAARVGTLSRNAIRPVNKV